MTARIPKLGVEPGNYAVEWFLDDRGSIPGEVSLQPSRPPEVTLFDDAVPKEWSKGGSFPEEHSFDRIAGRLRSGQDIVLTDVDLSIWFMGRSVGHARHATVGLNAAQVSGDAFHRARLQLTNLDVLFGTPPIRSLRWPSQDNSHMEGSYAIDLNPEAHHEWADEATGHRIECTYDTQMPLALGHSHYVAFAPVITLTCDEPLTVDRWTHDWVLPLLRLTTLATRIPQRLSWLAVSAAHPDSPDSDADRRVTASVFGGGIAQAPYEAEYRAEWRERQHRPLFTLASLPMSLIDLIRGWRVLEHDENPSIELFGLAMRHPDLPARARFLYLVQALETLHSHEHRVEDEEAQARFEERRAEILSQLEQVSLPSGSLRFIKDKWSKRRVGSLDRRLSELLAQMPHPTQESVSTPPPGEVLEAMTAEGPQPMEALLRLLRNDLSHGNCNYEDFALIPWVERVETICRVHTLRLLGFDEESTAIGLGAPPIPPVLGPAS